MKPAPSILTSLVLIISAASPAAEPWDRVQTSHAGFFCLQVDARIEF